MNNLNRFQREYIENNIDDIHIGLTDGNVKFIKNIYKSFYKKNIPFSVLDDRMINYKKGFTLLQYAHGSKNIELLRFLIYNTDIDINKKNRYGSTILHNFGFKSIIFKKFIKDIMENTNANVNIYNNINDLPLDIACFYGMKEYIQLLLCYGSKFNIKSCLNNLSYLTKNRQLINWIKDRKTWNTTQFRCEYGLDLWSPDNSKYWSSYYKKMVLTMFCVVNRTQSLFEKELLYMIFEYVPYF